MHVNAFVCMPWNRERLQCGEAKYICLHAVEPTRIAIAVRPNTSVCLSWSRERLQLRGGQIHLFACRGAEKDCNCGEAKYICLLAVEPRRIASAVKPYTFVCMRWSPERLQLRRSQIHLFAYRGAENDCNCGAATYICLHTVEPRTIAIAVQPHTFVCIRWSRERLQLQ